MNAGGLRNAWPSPTDTVDTRFSTWRRRPPARYGGSANSVLAEKRSAVSPLGVCSHTSTPFASTSAAHASAVHGAYAPPSYTSGATAPIGARAATASASTLRSAVASANASASVTVTLHRHESPSSVGCTSHAPGHVPSLASGAPAGAAQRTRKKLFELSCSRRAAPSASTRPTRPDGYTCSCTWHGTPVHAYADSAQLVFHVGVWRRSVHTVRLSAAQRRSASANGSCSFANTHSAPKSVAKVRRAPPLVQHAGTAAAARTSAHWRPLPRRVTTPPSMSARRTHGTERYE
mmetsp:Transcript_31084/g.76099  ORF Transcript_31084/g.76099 Transcript_31084/m.76099 type:complete len:291 (+) Transcript_31084:191-1063(+)